MVIPPAFAQADAFVDDRAQVLVSYYPRRVQGYIDRTGRLVIELNDDSSTFRFADGIAIVCKSAGGKDCRYIDVAGKTIWKARDGDWLDFGVPPPPIPPPPPPPRSPGRKRTR